MIADILVAIGSIGFLLADVKQAYKLFKNPYYDTTAFSKTHFRMKIFALLCTIIAYFILMLNMSIITASTQLLLNLYIIYKIGGLK